MRGRRLTLGLLAGLLAAAVVVPSRLAARVKEAPGEYAGRRARLIEQVGNPVVLFGYSGNEEISPAETFRQEENFYYLTGHEEPGAALLLIPQTEGAKVAGLPAEILFLPPRDKPREHWEGTKLGPDDPKISELTGFAAVKPLADLRGELERALRIFPHLYTLFPEVGPNSEATHAGRWLAWLKAALPEGGFRDVRGTLGAMRQVKSESEQKLLRAAIDHSIEAHRAAFAAVRPGLYEYEIAALMEYTFERAGCERPGYAPIVGSGFNSTVLHYDASRRQLQPGDLVVIDAGAECAGYTADITRTLPVSGTFTSRQREIYEIVLGAQNAVLAAVKPGMSFARTGENSLYLIAYNYINTHGKDSHGEPLGKYFIHGLGHHIGLQVHDAGDPYRPLAPGMIVTIEPGIYIPEENLGVRLEDIVLITETGAELLTSSLPRTAQEIEQGMGCKWTRLPEPVLAATRTETGQDYTRYWLTVTNWAAYPDMLFEPAPDLPPCGRNPNAARTWLEIHAEDGRYLYGYCGLSAPNELQHLVFSLPKGEAPPERVYVTITDRRCQKTYRSNLVSPLPAEPR